MTLWDTHCHLADARFAPDLADVLARATRAGLEAILVVAADPQAWDDVTRLSGASPGAPDQVFAYGLHPHEARLATAELWTGLHDALCRPRTVALGEIGLDHHYDHTPPQAQRAALERQLRMAADLDLPIILHERQAAEELVSVLRVIGVPRRGGVWHCFSGGPALAERAVDLGLHIGLGGLVTFPRGTEELRGAAAWCPGDRLLLETDSPYLSPAPHRGRRNEPARVAHVLAFLAELRGEDRDALALATTRNARRLFGTGAMADEDEGGGA